MGRDIRDMVVIDFDVKKVGNHPENVIVLPLWEGDREDRTLITLTPFLEHLARPEHDVREELELYSSNPSEKFNQVQNARMQMIKDQREQGVVGIFSKLQSNTVYNPDTEDDYKYNSLSNSFNRRD